MVSGLFSLIHSAWWVVFGLSQAWALAHLYSFFAAIPATALIGAYGLAIITLTLLLRLILGPIQQWQYAIQRKTMREQRIIAPRLAELRKRYKGDPRGLNTAMMALYREHGISPFSGFAALLPIAIQLPILIALFWVLRGFSRGDYLAVSDHFLFIPHLNVAPNAHLLLPFLPSPLWIVLPLLAAATTYIQVRIATPRASAQADSVEKAGQRAQQLTGLVMPIVVYGVSVGLPAGLGLYWLTSNILGIIQYTLFAPKDHPAAPAPAPAAASGEHS